MTLMPLGVAELFAGVGGFRIGFENTTDSEKRAAFEVIWSNQWEPSTKKQHASEIYTARWDMEVTTDDEFVYQSRSNSSDIHVNKDISTIETDEIPDIDLLCGGFPCQDYSVAKTADKAKGIQGKKGVLWWEIRRIIEEKQPKIVLLENVDRLLKSPTSQRGRDFAVMLASLDELGYVVEWRSINAADYGFPQRRRRVFILAYRDGTPLHQELMQADAMEYLQVDGVLSHSFPIEKAIHIVPPEFVLRRTDKDSLANVSDEFNKGAKKTAKSPFKTAGLMKRGLVCTFDAKPDYKGQRRVLSDVLQKPSQVSYEYYLDPIDILKPKGWKYLKGSKREERKGTDGFTYTYNEGPMKFPDPLDGPSRTIITGEGGSSASRFKHVVVFRPPKSANSALALDSSQHQEVRRELELKKTEWLRRLTPVELERLNMFPDNHTQGATDAKRAFFMGNALVVGIVERLASELSSRMEGF